MQSLCRCRQGPRGCFSRLCGCRHAYTTDRHAGQGRARQLFDWQVVVDQYNGLFADLAACRARALRDGAVMDGTRIQPNRGDPFVDFRGFASTVLEPGLGLRLVADSVPTDLTERLAVELNRKYPGLRGSPAEAMALLEQLHAAGSVGLSVTELLARTSPERLPYLQTTVVWLAKLGLIDWLPLEA